MGDAAEIRRANDDLSRLLRASIFPGAVSSFPKRSVTHSMLAEAEPTNPEFKCASPPQPTNPQPPTLPSSHAPRP